MLHTQSQAYIIVFCTLVRHFSNKLPILHHWSRKNPTEWKLSCQRHSISTSQVGDLCCGVFNSNLKKFDYLFVHKVCIRLFHIFLKIFVDFLISKLLRAQNTTLLSKVQQIFFQILWPSQKTQTLCYHLMQKLLKIS